MSSIRLIVDDPIAGAELLTKEGSVMERTKAPNQILIWLLTLILACLPLSALAQLDPTCCMGRVGDVNGAGGDEPTIADISHLITRLFIDNTTPLPCVAEADANQSGGMTPDYDDITISDISLLIDYLFITGQSLGLADCLAQSSDPYGYAVSTDGCKSSTASSSATCVMYQYDGVGSLTLTHQDAVLNCCPVPTLTVSIEGNTITITEIDDGLCDCYCLFDIEYRIENLPPGEYRIVVNEAVFTGGDPLDFMADLTHAGVNIFCVVRDGYPWSGALSGLVIDHTGCLSFDGAATSSSTPPNQSCISYEYDGSGVLAITHANAGFNCCPDQLLVDVSLEGSTITITESETLDQGGCDCLCLFDFEFWVVNLPPGEYRLVFEEPYVNQSMAPLDFTLDLTGPTSGTHCVERTNYPWDPLSGASGALLSHAGCKTFEGAALADPTPPNQSCIDYQYDGEGTLTFTHVNAGFNCCPTALSAEFDFASGVITVTEIEDLSGGGCYCLCLFDLDMEIAGLPPGEYRLVFEEPYVNQSMAPLDFILDLTGPTSGTHCVERTNYPWDPLSGASGALLSHTDCKTFEGAALADPTPPNQSCIDYQYDGEGTLTFAHVNAGFNCCPTTLSAEFDFAPGVITVSEIEYIPDGGCRCLCLFDWHMQISVLRPGIYRIIMNEPYRDSADPPFVFDLDLIGPTSGSVCVERDYYPWGL